MKNYKTKGVVLRSINLGEADKIITIYTEKEGKTAAVAKGVRRTKSRFGARLQPFTQLYLGIHRGRGLDIITSADIITTYPGLVGNLDKINYGYTMLELTAKAVPERQTDTRIYKLLITALAYLETADVSADLVRAAFTLKLLAVSGFLPNLAVCVGCNDGDKVIVGYSSAQGGMVCADCRPTATGGGLIVSRRARDLALALLYKPFKQFDAIKTTDRALAEIDKLLNLHLAYHLNIRLKSMSLLDTKECP